jgi:hypothetical protein
VLRDQSGDCRTNRLDGEDKDFGYIVDYKDLFKERAHALALPRCLLQRETSAIPGCERRTLLRSTTRVDEIGQGLLGFYKPRMLDAGRERGTRGRHCTVTLAKVCGYAFPNRWYASDLSRIEISRRIEELAGAGAFTNH